MEASLQGDVTAARTGDELAADRLISEYYSTIYAFLRRFTGSNSDAEDLTQITFTRVWVSLGSYARTASVSSWIHGLAYHVYVDWRRADRRGEPQSDQWWLGQVAPGPGPAEAAAGADLARNLYAAVDRLAPDVRITVHLRYYQGLTLQETADALGLAVSTVKYRLQAALAELQSDSLFRSAIPSKLPTHHS